MPTFTAPEIACLIVVVVATVIDFRTNKIPNVLTFPASFSGLIAQYLTSSWTGAIAGLEGWCVGLVVMIAIKMGRLGAGDVKLMAAVGAFLGPTRVLLATFYYCISFGAVSAFLIARVVPWKRLILSMIQTGTPVQLSPAELELLQATMKKKIPVAFAIAAGSFFAIVLEKQTLDLFGIK